MWQQIAKTSSLYEAIGLCRDRNNGIGLIEEIEVVAGQAEVRIIDAATGLLCYRILETRPKNI